MRNLALSDEILLSVEKPARYIGNEVNSVVKDGGVVAIRFALCFPDVYEIGMSNLGMQILYGLMNSYDDVWCERVFSPWVDLDRILRDENIPLFALESQEAIKGFDFVGFSLQYELCYTNVLQMLRLSRISLLASERTEDEPLVIGGGPCTVNPEPLAAFFDLFYIGEGEVVLRSLLDLYKEGKEKGRSRRDFLLAAAMLPGIYVPSLYNVHYFADGRLSAMHPIHADLPQRVKKVHVHDLSTAFYPTHPVVPFIQATQDRVVLELQRGCFRGCRFCQAGHIYRPVREKSAERIKQLAVEMLKNTGYDEVSLSSLSSSDYSALGELCDFLIDECQAQRTSISLPSLRIDAFSLEIMKRIENVQKKSLTFAPEAGSERLRAVIKKGLSEDEILAGAAAAFSCGYSRVKLYFMLGLPTEDAADILAIGRLADKIAAVFYDTVPKEERRGRVQIGVSTSFFVPKPHTPFQWEPQDGQAAFLEKAYLCRQGINESLNKKSIRYSWHETDQSVLECAFARGDRRLSDVILKAFEKGACYDAWSEHYRHDVWLAAFAETGLEMDFYTTRQRAVDELFPWDVLDVGVTKEYLWRERERAYEDS